MLSAENVDDSQTSRLLLLEKQLGDLSLKLTKDKDRAKRVLHLIGFHAAL